MALHEAHFQLTGRCNLSCDFCGQARGMLASDLKEELSNDEWLRIAKKLKIESEKNGLTPRITLWGGEPLLRDGFSELVKSLCDIGCELDIVTNGTLIEHHVEVLNNYIQNIYISIDGDQNAHDSIRGEGVFDKLKKNISLLDNRQGNLIFMTVISDNNAKDVAKIPFILSYFKPDRWIFNQLMYLSWEEYEEYQKIATSLGQPEYSELATWVREDDSDYLILLKRVLFNIEKFKKDYPMPVEFIPLNYPYLKLNTYRCPASKSRIHIRHDGETTFCTDYFGFSFGNIKNISLSEAFYGEKAQKVREYLKNNLLPTCSHCPWLGQQ